jgi:molecular chaperone GrpE (heat shock protein)
MFVGGLLVLETKIALLLDKITHEIESENELNWKLYDSAIDMEDDEQSKKQALESFVMLRKIKRMKASVASFDVALKTDEPLEVEITKYCKILDAEKIVAEMINDANGIIAEIRHEAVLDIAEITNKCAEVVESDCDMIICAIKKLQEVLIESFNNQATKSSTELYNIYINCLTVLSELKENIAEKDVKPFVGFAIKLDVFLNNVESSSDFFRSSRQLRLVYTKTLKKLGVYEIVPRCGDLFNQELHLVRNKDDAEDGKDVISKIIRKGYKFKEYIEFAIVEVE